MSTFAIICTFTAMMVSEGGLEQRDYECELRVPSDGFVTEPLERLGTNGVGLVVEAGHYRVVIPIPEHDGDMEMFYRWRQNSAYFGPEIGWQEVKILAKEGV